MGNKTLITTLAGAILLASSTQSNANIKEIIPNFKPTPILERTPDFKLTPLLERTPNVYEGNLDIGKDCLKKAKEIPEVSEKSKYLDCARHSFEKTIISLGNIENDSKLEALVGLGDTYMELKGVFDGNEYFLGHAEGFYKEAVRLNPDNATIHYKLGKSLLRQEKYDESEKELETAIKLNDKYAEAETSLGYIIKQTTKIKGEERSHYYKAIERDPSYTFSYFSLAFSYLDEDKKSDKSINILNKALENNVKDPSTIYYALGEVYKSKRDLDLAIESFEKCLELKPDSKYIKLQIEKIKRYQNENP